jgi:hypothetical protein
MRAHVRAVALLAARTADGAESELDALLMQLLAALDPAVEPRALSVDGVGRGVRYPAPWLKQQNARARREVAADALLIASRLGATKRAAPLIAMLVEGPRHPAPNTVLALARLDRFDQAQQQLEQLAASRTLPDGAVVGLRGRLQRATNLRRQARAAEPVRAAALEAQSHAELGAYLLALRRLAPLVEGSEPAAPLVPLYAQLLVAARLEERALATASRALGADRAAATVAQIRQQLPPELQRQRAVLPEVGWVPATK